METDIPTYVVILYFTHGSSGEFGGSFFPSPFYRMISFSCHLWPQKCLDLSTTLTAPPTRPLPSAPRKTAPTAQT